MYTSGRKLMRTSREFDLCHRIVRNLCIDLRGLTVLTEAATREFVHTPLLAAIGGADEVLCVSCDSEYGSSQEAAELLYATAREWDLDWERIRVIPAKSQGAVGSADIVTNLGFVRPIDATTVSWMKQTAVVPLMVEPWEVRDADVDIEACRAAGVCFAGTNEHHPALRTFDYLGPLAVKLLFELGLEVQSTRVAVLGGGVFGEHVADYLARVGCQTEIDRREQFDGIDAIVVCDYPGQQNVLGVRDLTFDAIARANPAVKVVHLAGNVDADELRRSGLAYAPSRIAPPGRMSVTTAYLGPKPVIDLHAGGLKVGETLAKERKRGIPPEEAVAVAVRAGIALPLGTR